MFCKLGKSFLSNIFLRHKNDNYKTKQRTIQNSIDTSLDTSLL